jgi:nucleoside phosphorylase
VPGPSFTILEAHPRLRNHIRAYNGDMWHSDLVVVRAFGTQIEADLAKSMLESAGIDAMIQADTAGGMRPHLAWGDLGFRVLVREDDAETARDVLNPPPEVPAEPPQPDDEDHQSSH